MPRDRSEEAERLSQRVIGSAIEVHRHVGPGQLEAAYHRAMEIELGIQSIAFQSEYPVDLIYKGHTVGIGQIDLRLGEGELIVELKSVERLAPIHDAQVLAYMRLTKCRLGLLLNFNVPLLKDGMKRFAL